MAHKKAAGSTRNGRDSRAKRLGIKVTGGQGVIPGNIIVRQKGAKYVSGKNTDMGRDFTIFATAVGVVKYSDKKKPRFDGRTYTRTCVDVVCA